MAQSTTFMLTVALALGAGLVSGVFYAFSSFVMAGLARLPPSQGLAAMQAINGTAVRAPFLTLFLGTAALSLAAFALALFRLRAPGSPLLLAAAALYLVGSLGVTIACNVPRNEALAACDVSALSSAAPWSRYLTEWTFYNHLRTVASALSSVCAVLSLLPLRA